MPRESSSSSPTSSMRRSERPEQTGGHTSIGSGSTRGYAKNMQMGFYVGQYERHHVSFSFDKFWGRLTIAVDGQSVVDNVRMFSLDLVKVWEFPVGYNERHVVRIEKSRAVVLAGFRPQPVSAFVDGVLVMQRDA